jgi:hypothetical protein
MTRPPRFNRMSYQHHNFFRRCAVAHDHGHTIYSPRPVMPERAGLTTTTYVKSVAAWVIIGLSYPGVDSVMNRDITSDILAARKIIGTCLLTHDC